jgi:hypothetical protein
MAGILVGGITAFLALAAALLFWLSRVFAARRLSAAAEAYAEREIARSRLAAKPHRLRAAVGTSDAHASADKA